MTAHTRTPSRPALSRQQYARDVAHSMSEDELQGHIVEASKLIRWYSYHTFDSRHSVPGFPDLVMVNEFQQRVIFSELKKQSGRQSASQLRWERLLRAVSPAVRIEFYLWRPSDWLDGSIGRILLRRPS